MHLVGFVIRIYHDARSAERQVQVFMFIVFVRMQEMNINICL